MPTVVLHQLPMVRLCTQTFCGNGLAQGRKEAATWCFVQSGKLLVPSRTATTGVRTQALVCLHGVITQLAAVQAESADQHRSRLVCTRANLSGRGLAQRYYTTGSCASLGVQGSHLVPCRCPPCLRGVCMIQCLRLPLWVRNSSCR